MVVFPLRSLIIYLMIQAGNIANESTEFHVHIVTRLYRTLYINIYMDIC